MASGAVHHHHKRLIHELIEQSHDRVAHVRAGQPLVDVFSSASSSELPPIASSSSSANVSSVRRERGTHAAAAALTRLPPASTKTTVTLPTISNDDDVSRVRTRRRAIGRSDKKLQKIATTAVAAAKSSNESAKSKLLRAVAAMKGHHAFLHVRHAPLASVPTADRFGGNAHLAFLEFKRQHDESRAPPTVSMTELNASTKTPIRFGDQICLLSMVSHLPLAVGADGHTLCVANSVIGPHTIFTLLDFRDPSRRDDVRMGDDVWLRIDSAMLQLKEPRDDVLALVVDLHYFLGCPGWLEDAPSPSPNVSGLPKRTATANAYTVSEGDALDTLKLAAMKAEVPAVDVYGDDQATREVAVETNASVLRLAKWRFGSLARHAADATARVLNCATLCVLQSDFALEFDEWRQRAVLRGSSRRRADATESKTTTAAALDITRRPSAAWQLRLVARPERERSDQAAAAAAAAASDSDYWLVKHEEQVARNARRIREKSALASDARRAHDRVTQQRDARLLDDERRKTNEPVAYFHERMQQQQQKQQQRRRQRKEDDKRAFNY